MLKKIISILLVISMVFGSIPGFDIGTQADNIKQEMKITIEGKTDTLYNDKITVTDAVYTPLDCLEIAIGADNISGGESSNGFFITGILGEKNHENHGWSYYVKSKDGEIVQPMVSVDKFDGLTNLEGELVNEELVFYMTSYSGANILTKIPEVTVEKDGANFTIKVVNYKVGKEPIKDVDIKVGNESTYKTNEDGEVSFSLKKAGVYDVLVSKDRDYPMIVRQHLTIVSDGDNSQELENIIEELKNSYKEKTDLNAIEVMAYNSLMNKESDYKRSFKLNDSKNAAAYAENIMGYLATGQDPSYYVDALIASQTEEGYFRIGEEDQDSVTGLADVITALDMAKGQYNIEKAVLDLVNRAKNGHYEDITTTAYALRALLKYMDIDGVEELASSCIDYLKQEQLETGGYDYYGMGNSPYSTGPVIQTLVLANEDLSSEYWINNNRTLVDSLLSCKIDGKGFELAEGMGSGYDDPTATQLGFVALADYYTGISMYERFTVENQDEDKDYSQIIDGTIDGLRSYYTSMTERLDSKWQTHPAFYKPLEALALNITSTDIEKDIEDIADKVSINENEGILPYAMNIIGLISSGQNPNKYVELLKEAQQSDGSFKVGRIEQTEWAVIALDMAEAEYDVEEAVKHIMAKNQNQKSVDILANALTALSFHKDISGVEDFIDSKLVEINSRQQASGGFMDAMDAENSLTLSYVISALVANGIDPLTDEDWIKDGNTVLDELMKYKKLNYFIYNDSYGDYMYKDECTAQAFIALADLKSKNSSYKNVQKSISYTGKIREGLEKTREYLTTTSQRKNNSLESVDVFYTWMEALAINHTSNELNSDYIDMQKKLGIDEKDNVLALSENIMGLIASGEILDNLEKDYIGQLIALQDVDGEFKEQGKESNVYKQSYGIMALDMAHAEYNTHNAISALINMSDGKSFGSVEETAWALIALSKHTDTDGVSDVIDDAVGYLKENQSDSGGFDSGYGDTPQYTGLVIQALIANGIDPLSNEWTKDGYGLVDSLLNNQLEDGTFRFCEMFGDNVDIPSTERAFAALADLYRGKSMYHSIETELDASDRLGNSIKDVKEYIRNKAQYNYLQSMALNILGIGSEELSTKLELREDEADRTYIVWDDPTEMHAKNIMGIIAIGQDPRDYKGKDYVSILEESQKENGQFNIEGEDENNISDQAYAIIALKMADGRYDEDKAIHMLMTKYEDADRLSIYDISQTIIALSFYKDRNEIKEKLDTYIEDLKSCQTDTGGFGYNPSSTDEVSEYTSFAIQAIVAADRNPLKEEFKKDGKTVLDALLKFKRDNHFITTEKQSSYKEYTEQATGIALAALIDLENGESIYHSLATESEEEPEDNKESIEKIIEDLRGYYLEKEEFTFRESMGYRYTSQNLNEDISIIESKYKANKNPDSASAYVGNIIGLISAGKNPKDYNGINYVKVLANSQNEQGKFIIGDYDDYPTTVAFSILALDMANGKYNIDKAIDALISYQIEDGGFGGVDETGMCLLALANHRNKSGVEEAINDGISFLKEVQLNTGGFEAWDNENPYSISSVIQGLIAVGEDPLSEEWIKNGNTMLDALLSFKVDDHFENKSQWGTEVNSASEQAFIALADLYRGKSMFKEIALNDSRPSKIEIQNPSASTINENSNLKLNATVYDEDNKLLTGYSLLWESSNKELAQVDQGGLVTAKKEGKVIITVKVKEYEDINAKIELTIVPEEIEITRVGNHEIRKGTEGRVEIRIKNNSQENKTATFIIALYDKDTNEMINYAYVNNTLESGESKNMGAGFLIPENGDYIIKGLVWDNIENQNIILVNPLVIDVE